MLVATIARPSLPNSHAFRLNILSSARRPARIANRDRNAKINFTTLPPGTPMTTSKLFEPYKLGNITLTNRTAMAPLTRNRAAAGFVPGPLAAEYYGQRASAGLLITEASQISQQGQGYQDTPGIYTPGAGRRLEEGHRCGARQGRPHLHPALACRPHLAYQPAAEWRRAGLGLGDCREDQDLRQQQLHRCLRAPRARACRNSRPDRRLQARREECGRGRLRRRRNPRRQWLSAGTVRARHHQQAHRCLRWLDREPRQADPRSGVRRSTKEIGADEDRHPHLAGDPGQ